MRVPWLAFAAASTLILLTGVACDDRTLDPGNAIVTDTPWIAPESYEYVLIDDQGDEQGSGTLSILDEGGQSVIIQDFRDDEGNSDRSVLLVDSETLLPAVGSREIIDAEDDRRVLLDWQYADLSDDTYGVRIRERNFDPASDEDPDSERCNPLRVPENTYDNDSSLFLWRTIEFREDHDVIYTTALPNRRLRRQVTLSVIRQERVETPAGSFDAWYMAILAEGQAHEAWFATTDDHKLLKYDNDNVIFLYTGDADAPPQYGTPPGVSEDCD
jgi:hypothetical protein